LPAVPGADEITKHVDAIVGRPDHEGITLALVVVHRGELIAEWYGTQPATPFGPATPVTSGSTLISWSTAKSMTHAAVGIMVADGRLDPDAPAAVPEWAGTPKAAITLLDLLEMRSGLRFVEDYVDGDVSNVIDMLYGSGVDDHAAYAAALPLDHAPGTVWNYSSGTTNIVSRIVGDMIAGDAVAAPEQRGRAIDVWLRDRLFAPAGMHSAIPKFDGAGNWVGSSYVYATARDFARFGELYRNDGVTESGARLLPPGWTDHGRTFVAHDTLTQNDADAGAEGFDYGRHRWMWPGFPGSIAAHGYEGQYVVVVPDRELTVVHLGKTQRDHQPALVARLGELIRSVPVG
jgi:CubicO group peptidase (beta-lactamase class C family)